MNDMVQAPKALLKAQKLANLTDSKIRIPLLGIRLGLDFLVGLHPLSLLVWLKVCRYHERLESVW